MTYGEDRDPIPAIPDPTVIFMINKCYREHLDDDAVYQCTRQSWVIGPRPREHAVYALGVANGVVRGAYRIDRWIQRQDEPTRWVFEGVPARELAHVVGTSIARIKARQGNASPVRLFLDGIPAPE